MVFVGDEDVPGKRVLRGVKYLILNPEINRFKRVRSKLSNLLVTMGGSDTHGATIKVVELLINRNFSATVIVGPGFEHHEALGRIAGHGITIKHSVPSLIKEFNQYDLAITGGGITPFEANASGLPCLVIANEQFEIPVAVKLQELGGSIFIGHHEDINFSVLSQDIPLEKMSRAGMENITTDGVNHVIAELLNL
jgi:spore coat polysaccharide biosynthesis predicted glycosyltransferase SpsG